MFKINGNQKIQIVMSILVAIIVFFIGFIIGVGCGLDTVAYDEDEDSTDLLIHCFECEVKMPVKEKNGNLFCSNCGLCH